MTITTLYEQNSYAETSKFEYWNQKIKVELSTLERIGTWKIVESLSNIKHIGCRWI